MTRYLAAFALIAAGFIQSASAQYFPTPGWNPYWNNNRPFIPARYSNPGIQYLGQLPNGTPVFNPWNMYNNTNYNGMFLPAYQPYYYNPVPLYYNSLLTNYYGYGAWNPYQSAINPVAGIEREPGRFIYTGRDLAINTVTGTRLAPARGIALTNEGAFYRVPGSGSITAWGAYLPGSGAYVNPMTGTVYNPGSGLIIRR